MHPDRRRSLLCFVLAAPFAAGVPAGPFAASDVSALVLAASRGDAARVGSLLASGADPNARGPGGRTALMAAAALGRHDIVRALLVRGAERDLKDSAGRNAFDYAIGAGQADTIALLRDAS